MGSEPRGIDPGPNAPGGGSAVLAFNDAHFTEYVYGDTTGTLLAGMPVFCYTLDAAEYNKNLTNTALSPTAPNSGGIVVCATNAAATNLVCVGIYWPESGNANAQPVHGDVIRVFDRGIVPVLANAKASGTAVLVGDILIVDSTPGNYALSGHNTFTTGRTIGQALATGTAITAGASIIAVPGSGNTTGLVNARVKLT